MGMASGKLYRKTLTEADASNFSWTLLIKPVRLMKSSAFGLGLE